MTADMKEFKRERREALLSMDEAKIRAYYEKYERRKVPADRHVFWIAVHKAVTGLKELPDEFRMKSKRWLAARYYSSLDDDLPPVQMGEADGDQG